MKDSKRHAGRLLTALAAGVLIWALFAWTAHILGPKDGLPEAPIPVCELTAFYGPFDQIALYRYYQTGSVQDPSEITERSTEQDGTAYMLEDVAGPVDTEFGPCWEALYLPAEPAD